jgi:ubiquinone biosynthesis protein
MKVGQILGMRADLLPPQAIAALSRLQDDVHPIDASTARRIVEDELGAPMAERFLEFDERPIASASIATVFRARLHDGRLVAVKIRRPEVQALVAQDLRLLRAAACLISRLPGARRMPMTEVVEEIAHSVERQIDFRLEATTLTRFRANLARFPHLHVPAVVEDHSGDAILTMEYVAPSRLDSNRSAESAGVRKALLLALHALYRMIFIDGLVHCDLHCGNLQLRGDGTAVIFDAGFAFELGETERIRFGKFFEGIVTGAGTQCARIILDSAIAVPRTFNEGAFTSAVAAVVHRASRQPAHQFNVARFVLSIFAVQRQFGIRSTAAFTMPIIALLVMEGLVRKVAPDTDFQAEARPFLAAALLPGLIRERTMPY